ncbi:MAG: AcrR family transcriptional regulator [Shewanella sp.]|jgi:AcrR family transcriptional regulator
MVEMKRRPKEGSKQAIKSANTQEAFLKAALDCYVSLGYILTTTTTVAEKAGLSRGAMVHHFPSKRTLVEASIYYLNQQRIATFSEDMSKLAKKAGKIVGQDGLNVYWKLLNSKYYTAYFELRMASRTDKELGAILKKADNEFEINWQENIKLAFPEWNDKTKEQLQLAMDVTQTMMEGLTLCNFGTDTKRRQKLVLLYVRRAVQDIYMTENIEEILLKK